MTSDEGSKGREFESHLLQYFYHIFSTMPENKKKADGSRQSGGEREKRERSGGSRQSGGEREKRERSGESCGSVANDQSTGR